VLLAIDIGNTQTSFGVFDKDKLLHHWRAETRVPRTSDEYASFLYPLLGKAGLADASWEGVALCSVVPAADATLQRFCTQYLKAAPVRIDNTLDLGVKISVDFPAEVGADRLANAAYAARFLELPAVVIDLGTATTFDVITKDGYQGGIILPGPRLGVAALSGNTAKLPPIDLGFPKSVIGKNTVACIQSGMSYGYLDLLEGLLGRILAEVGPCEVALTGGLSYLFQQKLKAKAQYLPNLTLEGTALLYRKNVPAPGQGVTSKG
jgi:type III pantothenate kinase